MKKSIHILFALIAVLGIVNCFIIEPALAAHQETTCTSDDGCDDCFICCAFSHQILPSTMIQMTPSQSVLDYIEVIPVVSFDAPTFSIFHPPLVV